MCLGILICCPSASDPRWLSFHDLRGVCLSTPASASASLLLSLFVVLPIQAFEACINVECGRSGSSAPHLSAVTVPVNGLLTALGPIIGEWRAWTKPYSASVCRTSYT